MSVRESFWFVARDCQRTTVSMRHDTLESARAEAERLCDQERAAFIVLEAVARVEPFRRVVWEEYDRIPF